MQTVKLEFRGPIHLGKGRLSDSSFSCDAATLFSALYIEALRMGVADDLLDAARCGGLKLSDTFPYIGDTLYLPKPMVATDAFDTQSRAREARGERMDSRERKANKKLAYVPAASYPSYLAGTFDAMAALEGFELGNASLQARVNLTRADGGDARPYFVGGYSFAPGAGLYFMSSGTYDLVPLLEQLSYSGLGGKRTSGYGRFEFCVQGNSPLAQVRRRSSQQAQTRQRGKSKRSRRRATAQATHATQPKTYVLLSSALPAPDELTDALLEGARYRLVHRGGFVQSTTHSDTPQKKRDMYLFAAGSTFERRFEGDVFDVNATSGSHAVWRYAKAMWAEV